MYDRMIRETAERIDRADVDPRHIEAWMRVEHPCLDGLSWCEFDAEVATAIACVDAAPAHVSEALAESCGL